MKIALLGCGVVGGGIVEIVDARSDLELKYVLVRGEKPGLGRRAVSDINIIINDAEVGIVVEAMGGLHPAYEYACAAMRAGKNFVTANKHLVAHYYAELTALAKECGVAFRCTPAVGGGIPWLVNLERVLRLDAVSSVSGIMNGTTNYILDAMHKNGAPFSEVLAEAQRLGYAEADPAADIDGLDILRKCVISSNIAFGVCIPEDDVAVFGIRSIASCDIAAAESLGRTCKMLAFGKALPGGIAAYVEPCFVKNGEPEAAVSENRNLISFESELCGKECFYGQGAGRKPTAYNAVSDCIDILSGEKHFYTELARPAHADNSLDAHPYYVRFSGDDAWLRSVADASCGEGVVTRPVSVAEMHAWARSAGKADASLFIAGLV